MKKSLLFMITLSTLLNAESFSFTKNIRVSSSHPKYQRVSEQIPYQECRDVRVPTQRAYSQGGTYNDNDAIAGSVIGGTIGGVLGHQIGEGRGKDAATIGGAILGTIVGGNMVKSRQSAQQVYSEPSYQVKRECVTKYRRSAGRQELVGYENIAYYQGRKIVKYSDEPLSYIPVTVTISY
jgi:uncharacterized protein YcfJ